MESKKSSKIITYQKKLKKLLNKNIFDIILFGSFVKGGSPGDIDIAVIIKEKKEISIIKNQITTIIKEKSDIQFIDISSIHSSIWLTLIKEGFSVSKNKYLFEIYNTQPVVLYKYSLTRLTNVQKVQFERGIKKILGKESKFLTRSVILIPIILKNEMMEFLKTWDIYYESQEYELLPILRKEDFL